MTMKIGEFTKLWYDLLLLMITAMEMRFTSYQNAAESISIN